MRQFTKSYIVEIYIDDEYIDDEYIDNYYSNQQLSDVVRSFIGNQKYGYWCVKYSLGRKIRFRFYDEQFALMFNLRFG